MRGRSGSPAGRSHHLHAVPDLADDPAPVRSLAEPHEQHGESGCRCAHSRDAHDHFRRGTDCGLCECRRFTPPAHGWATRLRA